MQFCQVLTNLLKEKGLTNYALSRALGIHATTVANWLNGAKPSAKTLEKLCVYFDVSADYLLGKTEQRAPAQEGPSPLTKDDIKFGIFGRYDISDELLDEVLAYAQFVEERKYGKKSDGTV